MKKKSPLQGKRSKSIACLAFSCFIPTVAYAQTTGFNKGTAGPLDYNLGTNWVGGNINGIWDSSLTLSTAQTVTFAADSSLGTGLSFGYSGNQPLTLRSNGSADRTITLGGDIIVAPVSNQTVTIGSLTANEGLNVNLGGNRTATISANKSLRFYDAISGGNLTLSGTATTGRIATGGMMILSGDSAVASSSSIIINKGASLSFDSSASGSVGATRAQSLGISGGELLLTGNSGGNTVETITGSLSIGSGQANNTVTLTSGAGTHLQLSAGSLARTSGGAALFRGTNLGVNPIASPTANSANISFGTTPTLIGGVLGTKGAGIIPWAVIDTSATGFGSSFATYDSTNGLRALNASEYSTTIATDGSTDGHNIKLASGTALTVNGATTVNSLFVSSDTGSSTALAGTGALTITSGAAFFDLAPLAANSRILTISKALNFGATQGVLGTTGTNNAQRQVRITGDIAGSGGLVFYDTAVNTGQASGFLLNNAYSYTGDTYINGQVTVGVNNALANFSNAGRTGDVYLNGSLKLSAANASIQINGLWGNGVVGSEFTNANKTLVVGDNNATSTFGGYILGENGFINLAKMGTGTLTLTSTNSSYAGATSVRNGTLSAVTLNSVAAPNATSSLGRVTTVAAGTIALGLNTTTGTLRVTGTGETTDRVINLTGTTGGGGIEQAGTGLLKFTSDFTATGNGIKTLTLSGSSAGTGEIAGAIVNSGSTTSVTKSGTGTWTLSSTSNSYTGATNVNEGKLVINGSTSTGIVSVASGATLGGSGTVGGVTTISGILAPGNSIDTFTVNNDVTWNGAATVGSATSWQFELGLGNTSDMLDITGAGSDFLKGSGSVFNFDFLASANTGTFTLVDWADANSTTFGASDFTYSNLGGGYSGTFSITGSQLNFTVIPEPNIALLTGAFGLIALLRRRRA